MYVRSSAHTCTYVQHTKLVLFQVPFKALHYGVKSQEPVQPPDSALRKNPTVDSSDKSHNDMRRALIHYINPLYTSVCCVCTLYKPTIHISLLCVYTEGALWDMPM